MRSRPDRSQTTCVIGLEPLEPRRLLSAAPLADGLLDSPAVPPAGLVLPVCDAAVGAGTSVLLSEVPEYFWYRGCAPTSAGMILGYWDTLGYPNYIPGDATYQTFQVNQAIASTGHDYDYYFADPDRNPPTHTDDCIADFMGASRDPLGAGWSYVNDSDDGINRYGDWVGYSCSHAWNEFWGELTWSDVVAEINARRPMMLMVDSDGDGNIDHAVPMIGYRTEPTLQYAAYTTWQSQSGVQWFDWQPLKSDDPWGVGGATYFHPSRNQPDLVAGGLDVWPTTTAWGNSFTCAYDIDNFGSVAASRFDVRFYLSADEQITSGDYPLGTVTVPSLAAAAALHGEIALSLPFNPPSGFTAVDSAYVGMIVDAGHAVSEGVETNNSGRGDGVDRSALHISGKPDLVGASLTLESSILNLGAMTAEFAIANAGEGAAPPFVVRFYLSQDDHVAASDILLAEQTVAGIGGGNTCHGSVSLAVPTSDPFGDGRTYALGMIIDALDDVNESSEGNNANRGWGQDKARVGYGGRIFYADFEHGDGAMNLVNDTLDAPVDGLWHLTTHRGGQTGHSGERSLHYGRWDDGEGQWDYDAGHSHGTAFSKWIELPDGPVALAFNYLCQVEPAAGENPTVLVSDGQTTSTVLLSKFDGLDADTGGDWQVAMADLTAFAGRSVRLRFELNTLNAEANDYEGWYIDDIAVWAVHNPITFDTFRSLNHNSDYRHAIARIDHRGDHDAFVFNEEQFNGTFTITATGNGSPVAPALAVYDYLTGEMLAMDAGSGDGGAPCITLGNTGLWNSYLVEVWDAAEQATGDVGVLVDGEARFPTLPIALDAGGRGSIVSTINSNEDTDYFRIQAPAQAPGVLEIVLHDLDVDLRTRLQVWRGQADAAPEAVAHTEMGDEVLHLPVRQPGELFYLTVADHDFSASGRYEITVDFHLRRAGDADEDGDVDLDDFVALKQNFGAADAAWSQGDFDGSGTVDLDDFVILKQNFGAAAAVRGDRADLLTETRGDEALHAPPAVRRIRRRLIRTGAAPSPALRPADLLATLRPLTAARV
ncbi:MAG: hypothetical protein GX591_18810 [Planctomycetes bacterium]|nr:hypothetical protein [Planctomycetota bacterium]